MTAPLSGIKVIEIGTLIAAPFAARLMAEFGAEVIKIEAMGQGDPLRKWRKLHEGTSLWWYLQSRNKKSLALDLKSPEGLGLIKQLLGDADVLIENLRPTALVDFCPRLARFCKTSSLRVVTFEQTAPPTNHAFEQYSTSVTPPAGA